MKTVHSSNKLRTRGRSRAVHFILILSITAAVLVCLPPAFGQPRIITEPKDRFLNPGVTSSLSVTAAGAGPVYQWLCNGVPLEGMTNRVLNLRNVQPDLNGDYHVVVSDASGSITSQVARVKVFVPAPHAFESLQAKPGERATLTFTGETSALFGPYNDLYPVEVSPNLVDWSPLAMLQRANRALVPLTFSDTDAAQLTQRFYRLQTNLLVTPFPPLTGPFAVGMLTRCMIDPARTNYYRYNNKTNAFMVTFWYPAEPQAGLDLGPTWDYKLARDWSGVLASVSGNTTWPTILTQFKGHAWLNAPMAPGTDRYPVILHSHGYSAWRQDNTRDAEELASHGYIVVAMDHEDCWGTEFPDGRYLTTPYPNIEPTDSVVRGLLSGRIRDLSCVVDELHRMDASDPVLGGRMDLDYLGTFGTSLGGSPTAFLSLTNDAVRCTAFLDWGCRFDIDAQFRQTGLRRPFLMMNSDYVAADVAHYHWSEAERLFGLAQTDAVIFQIRNTSHFSFSDQGWYFPAGMPWNTAIPGGSSRVIAAALVSFFNKHLKGQDDGFLAQPPQKYPDEECEVFNFQCK
ncbi:MAG: hypothetical protein AB9869_30650 [Verrucomicrobiia bacterium]